MRIVAIIQARMGSTRLPGKVLKNVCGQTIIEHIFQRVHLVHGINEIVVATTTNLKDDCIELLCKKKNISCFRGQEDDVLDRYYRASVRFDADIIIRITADCPLLDPVLLSEMIRVFLERCSGNNPIDYLSNTLRRTYPRGLDLEIFTSKVLKRVHTEAHHKEFREHVTLYITTYPDRFRCENYESVCDNSHHRWTLDSIEDFYFIKSIYRLLYKKGQCFSSSKVYQLLELNPRLLRLE